MTDSRTLQIREEDQPRAVRAIAWQAQVRLSRRYRALKARQVPHNKVCVAVAWKLFSFVWSVARQIECRQRNSTDTVCAT